MRALLVVTALALSPSVRADSSLPFAPAERSPIGTACDAALAGAQRAFTSDPERITFHLTRGTYAGAYRWSDRCGVYGDYQVALRREPGPATRWRGSTHHDLENGDHGIEQSRRKNGWRATITTHGTDDKPGVDFIEHFRPALDACLAAAAASRS